jgi:dolichol-phosphate mannosyltransferase
MNISVIVALFNEEDSVPLLLSNLALLKKSSPDDYNYEFLLINDGSKDDTLGALEKNKTDLPIKVISHAQNKGFGAAFRTGIENATGEVIVCYDADCTYPILDSLSLIQKLSEGYAVVTANPFHESKKMEKVPIWRQALTWSNALLYKIVLGKNSNVVTVMSCAFRAYRSDVLKQTLFRSNGFGAASEVLGRMIINKQKVSELPSSLSARQFGVSKMNVRKAVKEHLGNLGLFMKIRFFKF